MPDNKLAVTVCDILNNHSYGKLYESFLNLFPEFKQSVSEWEKDKFTPKMRSIWIKLKNGIYIFFCSNKDEDGNWTYSANLEMSDKVHKKYNITAMEE